MRRPKREGPGLRKQRKGARAGIDGGDVVRREVVVDRAAVQIPSTKPTVQNAGLRGLLWLAGALLLALTQAGCGNACLSLASQICLCLPDDGTRAACNTRAKEGATSFPVREEDEAYCQQKLDAKACDCKLLNNAETKLACGFSYPTTP